MLGVRQFRLLIQDQQTEKSRSHTNQASMFGKLNDRKSKLYHSNLANWNIWHDVICQFSQPCFVQAPSSQEKGHDPKIGHQGGPPMAKILENPIADYPTKHDPSECFWLLMNTVIDICPVPFVWTLKSQIHPAEFVS